jgi:two-component system nitrate/nitrite response regulator NarL
MPRCRIVLADDHEMFREGLSQLIGKESDFKIVGQAKDGEKLLEIIKSTPCDVAVVDLSMPGMDGMAAIKEIHQKYSKVKILVLTMQKDHEHFKHAMHYGASGYLLKDDTFDQLVLAIKQILRGKQYISSSVAKIYTERFIRSMDDVEAPSMDILTKREAQILGLIANGSSNKMVASKLKLSIRTVETHRSNLTNKLGIKTTAGLVKYAIAKGLA